jgi:hypothetical protein
VRPYDPFAVAVLRRLTENILSSACLLSTVVVLLPAIAALVDRPETRWPALAAWILLAAGAHALTGERPSKGSVTFIALFTLPLTMTGVAVYELHERWQIPLVLCGSAIAVVFALFGLVLVRLMIAAGSADYP